MSESRKERWDKRYQDRDLPWDTGKPDRHLLDLVTLRPVAPCRALEVGCGTGTNALWLASEGFTVTGLDIAPEAIEQARKKITESTSGITFKVFDFLNDDIEDEPYEFAYDRGCFHSFDEAEERARFAEQMAAALTPGALWLSLMGSTDGPPRESGPPRRSARDITAAVEEHFELLTLCASHFESEASVAPRAWHVVLRRRSSPPQPSTRRDR